MGKPVDKANARPFHFSKSPSTLLESGATAAYPPQTQRYHCEMELALVIGKAGFQIAAEQAQGHSWGYACGLDMTRRDLQLAARDQGRPLDLGKDIEHGSVIAPVLHMPGVVLEQGELALSVNGQVKQKSDLAKLI